MPNIVPQFVAGGDIYPCRFVALSTTADFTVVLAGSNAEIIGVSQEGTRYPPLEDMNPPTVAAKAGDQVKIFTQGDVCLLEVGGSPVNRGNLLYSDANGKAAIVPTTGTNIINYGAIALHSAAAGEKVLVQLRFGKVRPALS